MIAKCIHERQGLRRTRRAAVVGLPRNRSRYPYRWRGAARQIMSSVDGSAIGVSQATHFFLFRLLYDNGLFLLLSSGMRFAWVHLVPAYSQDQACLRVFRRPPRGFPGRSPPACRALTAEPSSCSVSISRFGSRRPRLQKDWKQLPWNLG